MKNAIIECSDTLMICFDPFKNSFISATPGGIGVSPCCLVPPKTVEHLDFQNNEYLNAFRSQWKLGQVPTSCQKCVQDEKEFGSSRRQDSIQWYRNNNLDNTDVDLVTLDFWVGNVCNLRCAICSEKWSSAWQAELGLHNSDLHSVNSFWKDLDLTKVRAVHFNGGEPLLSKEHVKFLEALPNKGSVIVSYNTNGTILPSEKLIELWSDFELVKIVFSIDDVEDAFEYQRFPAKWADVTKNLKWFVDHAPVNCMFGVHTTVSILNSHRMDQLNTWLDENFNQNRCGDPVFRSTHLATGRLDLRTVTASTFEFLDSIDRRRGLNWRELFPELLAKYQGVKK